MAINTIQIAWLSRLVEKGVISPGQSIVEFSPQDVLAPRAAVRKYGLRHNPPDVVDRALDEIFHGEKARPDGIPAFYKLLGFGPYRCTDLLDTRVDWTFDFNNYVKLPTHFDVATNFGTAEHVFNIGTLFNSIHDALLTGGVALHVLPTFGDIDHGFYNVHPTVYLDLAAANDYKIEDVFYGDRWDIRNKMLEADLTADFDFDNLPIRLEHMKDRALLQRAVTALFVANYNDPDTKRYGTSYPSMLYDYIAIALRKTSSQPFRVPMQGIYGLPFSRALRPATLIATARKTRERGVSWFISGVARRIRRVWRSGR